MVNEPVSYGRFQLDRKQLLSYAAPLLSSVFYRHRSHGSFHCLQRDEHAGRAEILAFSVSPSIGSVPNGHGSTLLEQRE
jgi:hypothetical protein